MKKGISLITLIITIIVIIILSAAVILTISNTGVIDNAKIASLASDQSNLQTSIELYLTNIVSSNLELDFDKEKILFGNFKDSYRIVKKDEESLVEAVITKKNEEIYVYKLDEDLCKEKGIEFPKTPSKDSYWYISKSGQVYLVYDEGAKIPKWIIGKPSEGKQIENEDLTIFVGKIGDWEQESESTINPQPTPDPEPEINIYDIIPVADVNMFEYTTPSNGTVQIKGFNSEYAGIIPTEIKFPTVDPNGNTIIGINSSAFFGNTNLTTVIIPEGVTTLGAFAFGSCTSLKEVSLPTTITTIYTAGNDATFHSCNAIEKITIPNSVTSGICDVPADVFSWARSSIKEINFNEEITSIGNSAFGGCTALETIEIPNTITSIGNYAFQGCTSLSGKITIPENVESIGNSAFENCKNITEIDFLSKGKLVSIGNSAFNGDSAITSLKIPEGVATLGTYAFRYCTALKEVSLPTTIATIYTAGNDGTFHSCNAIEKITIPNSVTSGTCALPAHVFGWAQASIKEVNFLADVNTIASIAFISCTGLESIAIPNTVTSIASNAFTSCSNLKTIVYSGTASGAPWGAPNATIVAQ